MQTSALQVIHERRSIRRYKDTPIPSADLERILDAGIWAPSALNKQPWHFTVITDRALIDSIHAQGAAWLKQTEGRVVEKHCLHHAPCVLLVSGRADNHWAPIDCALASQNVLLAARALGYGSCFIGMLSQWLQSPAAADFLTQCHIPDGYQPQHFIALGTPDEVAPAPARIEQTITYL